MFRTTRVLLCALCLLTLGFAALPAAAQTPPPPPGPIPASAFAARVPLIQTVRVVGAGETEAEALANALTELRSTYFVLRHTVLNSFCAEIELPGSEDPFGNPEVVDLCAAEVEARVVRKATIFP